jgi:spermidine/putrescine ABC transporter ATP-binding subunit
MKAITGHLRVERLCQRFGEVAALDDVSFEAAPGEFVTLLGPSGSGKTTTLRIIAGFSRPMMGRVLLNDKDLTVVPPHLRDIGVVFQHYALFPHLSVTRNLAFPLQMRKWPKRETPATVEAALARVRMEGLGERMPRELSGGQQQRVALARALIFRPQLLLMDEPLGALDRKLREEMQDEIVRISRAEGITVVYVTHDQEEALAMSDRIAVYHRGRIEQIGTPQEVYERPKNLFVANFIGESTTLRGRLAGDPGAHYLVNAHYRIPVDEGQCRSAGLKAQDEVAVVVRPEALRIARDTGAPVSGRPTLPAKLRSRSYLGSVARYIAELPDQALATVRSPIGAEEAESLRAEGEPVVVSWDVPAGIVLPADRSLDALSNAAAVIKIEGNEALMDSALRTS